MYFFNLKNAIEDFKRGKFVILIDEKTRENEADLVLSAEKVTPQKINFMIKNARGLICVPMLSKRLDKLKLPLMTKTNTEFTKCAFTISVDAKNGTTTGVSAYDRAKTIKALIDESTKPYDFARPGHVFPLRCDENGLNKRTGHTEAAIELAKLAKLYPAAVICEIIGENGKMAKMPELRRFAKRYNLKIIKINELVSYLKLIEKIKTFIS
ncbi:3,4-dihydroxy-2-butanone-4-phosphate synthase [Candidatus Woesearchaeota archaeon]|nr:3,4-dihydroxy-2-butanone-4-phosphate synthase [Candidatus Woesearchaeota archaeon]